MKICGLQKLTLADFPGKVAATVFTGGCDFRCPFCHNALLVTRLAETPDIPQEEVFSYLRRRAGVLDGVCVTGGEPLLQPDIAEFLASLRSLGLAVKLDTNGSHPAKLRELCAEGLCDYVAMDIKNALPRYAETIGMPGFDTAPVAESADFLISGGVDYEFRTTCVAELHSDESFRGMGERFSGAKRWFLQRFADSGCLISQGLSAPSPQDMERFRSILSAYVPDTRLREM